MKQIDLLLVEDNSCDAEMTIRALRKNHLTSQLVHLKDGAQALDFLFARGVYCERLIENTPKLILLDIKMPKVGGIEVLTQLKADARTKRIPIVMLTSSKEDPDIRACYELGVNSYVVKPVDFEQFQKAITEIGLFWIIFNELPQ